MQGTVFNCDDHGGQVWLSLIAENAEDGWMLRCIATSVGQHHGHWRYVDPDSQKNGQLALDIRLDADI